MIIRGILDRSLSNQLCIRGFASIKQLAHISKADYSYQRDLYGEQEEIVKRFLETERYLFFPEIILSYKFNHKGNSANNPFRNIKDFERQERPTINAKSNIDGTRISVKKFVYNASDTRGKLSIQMVELELDDQYLSSLIEQGNQPFHRIDGNHRLTVAENSTSPIVEGMTVPYCIILGEEYFNRDGSLVETEDTREFEKSIRVYFHNINTKSLPLSSEQNLSVILDPNSQFSLEEIETIFPKTGVSTREFIDRIDAKLFSGLENILDENFRNVANSIFSVFNEFIGDVPDVVTRVVEAFKTIDQLYIDNDKFKSHEGQGLFIALVYYHVKDKKQYQSFLRWIITNHLFETTEILPRSIIKIYDKLYEKKVFKMFVAMPYYSHSTVNDYNKLFREICSDVSKKANVQIELIPIMRFRGKSQRIDQRLLDKIKECDVFVADITGNNINVIFEVGYAECRGIPMILLKKEEDEVKSPFDMDKLQYLPYPSEGYYNDIKSKVSNNLVEILSKEYNIYFK
jgi:nucleoside 2-deoxyribosyltransferase